MRDRARLVAISASLVGLIHALAAAQPALEAGFDDEGLTRLDYAGESFVQTGTFRVRSVAFRTWDGRQQHADLVGEERTFDAELRRLTLSYTWGEVRCTYDVEIDQLCLGIEVENRGDAVLTELSLSPMETRFPKPPKGWVPHMPYRGFNLGWPTVNVAECETAVLVVCNEETGRPLQVGWAGRESLAARPMIVSTVSDWAPELINPQLYRPIYPGQADRFDVSIRFAPPGTDPALLSDDLEARFAEAYPRGLEWTDPVPSVLSS